MAWLPMSIFWFSVSNFWATMSNLSSVLCSNFSELCFRSVSGITKKLYATTTNVDKEVMVPRMASQPGLPQVVLHEAC